MDETFDEINNNTKDFNKLHAAVVASAEAAASVVDDGDANDYTADC